MHALLAEFVKLKRSLSWAVVIVLPIILVTSGSIMTLIDGRGLEHGWHTLWMRSFVFYGLFPLAVGIAILAALVWRVEHRGSNWNALMAGPASSLRIVLTKAGVIAALAVIMQILAVGTVLVLGRFAFGLPGFLPMRYLLVSVVLVVACVPVVVVQSWLSMQWRSFAAPVAAAFVGSGVSVLLLLGGVEAAVLVSPYAAVSRAAQLGTGTFADSGAVTAPIVIMIAVASLVLAAVLAAAHTVVLERSEVRT